MLNVQGKQYQANEVVDKNMGAISASGYSDLNSVWAVL